MYMLISTQPHVWYTNQHTPVIYRVHKDSSLHLDKLVIPAFTGELDNADKGDELTVRVWWNDEHKHMKLL